VKAPRPPRLVIVGSSNTDLVIRCPHLPGPGETIGGGDFARIAGGKGANQAVAAARAGARVTFVGRRGADEFGRAAAAGLRLERIGVTHFRVSAGAPSGIAIILLDTASGENLIAVANSANDLVSPADVAAAAPQIARADAVVAQLEIPLETVLAAARLARQHGVPFILNPAPAGELPAELLRLVDFLTPNENETQQLTGEQSSAAAAAALHERGVRNVVITRGARGAFISDGQSARWIAAPRVEAIDTVGAGDCFTAWLAVSIAEGLPLADAARRATAAAAISVTRAGAQASMPRREEVEGALVTDA